MPRAPTGASPRLWPRRAGLGRQQTAGCNPATDHRHHDAGGAGGADAVREKVASDFREGEQKHSSHEIEDGISQGCAPDPAIPMQGLEKVDVTEECFSPETVSAWLPGGPERCGMRRARRQPAGRQEGKGDQPGHPRIGRLTAQRTGEAIDQLATRHAAHENGRNAEHFHPAHDLARTESPASSLAMPRRAGTSGRIGCPGERNRRSPEGSNGSPQR